MLKFISRHILTGLITILPVLLSFYLLYWFAVTAETMLGTMIRLMMPEEFYWPGMGLVVGLVVIFLIGLMMHAYIVQRLFAKGEKILYRMPLIKSLYRAIRDFFDYFSPNKEKEFNQVVSVHIGETGMQVIGFVTQAVAENLPEDFRGEDSILVYIPLSYMIGGYSVLMPRTAVRPLNMTMDDAMRFTLTAGVTK
ncbi:MAG: DUF502 domain-containing protein [Gammaproteobacteria bacterium]|nr:DUF502 domain-containing protein [Gammaproteobacteria bacterium]MCW8910827.1 DUF502 domain-containing protein [Gammaproteobacteria bacterium]MCW9006236.1 DUF502 domain-containing protein [Gammaproteobacteria bacterium]MCW9055847.1 DUF502 domain-containing protein [Gammaproteobacteria bacterium]